MAKRNKEQVIKQRWEKKMARGRQVKEPDNYIHEPVQARNDKQKEFYKFPSIESFHNKTKQANRYGHSKETFIIRPKLHGTNAAIVFNNGEVYAQSRKRVITTEDDNAGFAKFVDNLNLEPNEYNYVVYGEWCGGNVQKGHDAICQLEDKIFAVFAVYDLDSDIVYSSDESVKHFVKVLGLVDYVTIVDTLLWIEFSFLDAGLVAEEINDVVKDFETVDPWVKKKFGIEAPGEGVVVSPVNTSRDHYSNWTFKAKTEAHSVNKSKKPAQLSAKVSKEAVEFAEQFATEQRFEQAVNELGIDFDMKDMGEFLKWVSQDVKKESADELEASGLEWKDCVKQVTNIAKTWFMNRS